MTTPRKAKTGTPDSTTEDTPAPDTTAATPSPSEQDSGPVDTTDSGKDTAAKEPETITLATPPFTAEFHAHGHIITTAGTEIPAGDADQVRFAALRSGIALREI